MKKTTKTIKSLKSKLKKTLPQRISRVIDSYDEFSDVQPSFEPKEFIAYHNACKSAVAHVDSLLKLSSWTEDKKAKQAKDDKQNKDIEKQALEEIKQEINEQAINFDEEDDE